MFAELKCLADVINPRIARALLLAGCAATAVALIPDAGLAQHLRVDRAIATPWLQHSGSAVSFYVSPSGSDKNPGTMQRPFLTPRRAQSAVRGLDAKMKADIHVYLESGTYRLSQPLKFSRVDSGSNGYNVVWTAAPGATPVISGAVRISHWHLKSASKNIWAASLPHSLQTRQLYVDGVRATPAEGPPPVVLTKTATGYTASSDALDSWTDPRGLNFVYLVGMGRMTESSCPVAAISGATITMAQPCWDNSNERLFDAVGNSSLRPPTPSYIENAYQQLDDPGQFVVDLSSHTAYYIPRPGQDMETADVEAPGLQALVSAASSPSAPVHNIEFSGIQFAFATWMQPSSPNGFSEVQANFTIVGRHGYETEGLCHLAPHGACPYGAWTKEPAAIQFTDDRHIIFTNDQFVHLGGAGVALDNGSQSDSITGSVFTDISGNGVEVGNVNLPEAPPDEQTKGVIVDNNHVYAIGVEFNGAVAIFVGYAADCSLSHNQIDDVPYAAISIGWGGWPDKVNQPPVPNFSHGNLVSDNLIFDYMQDLNDGGAVYTQGVTGTSLQTGEHVLGNVAYDQVDWSEALKWDDGATYVTDSDNVTYNDTYDWGNYHLDTSGDGQQWDTDDFSDNYFQQGYPLTNVNGVVAANNYIITGPQQAPATILQSAGVQPQFQDVLAWKPAGALVPYAPEEVAPLYLVSGTAYVTWHPSPNLVGEPVQSYTVAPCVWTGMGAPCEAQGALAVTISATDYEKAGYATLSGLTAGTYGFTVTANDAAGSSTPSVLSVPISNDSTEPPLAGPIQNPGQGPGQGAIRLDWYPPQSATCALVDTQWCSDPVLYYVVKISPGSEYQVGGISRVIVSNHGGRVEYLVGGLTPGTDYTASVWAVTPAGPGPATEFPAVTAGPLGCSDPCA